MQLIKEYYLYYVVQHHNNSVIKSVTKYACNNPLSVCGSKFVCVNGVVAESVNEI